MSSNHFHMYRRFAAVTAVIAAAASATLVVPGVALADDVRDEQWHLNALEVDKVHKLSKGKGVTIGLIDSGVDAEHEDLKGNVKAGKDFGTKGNGLNDERGHGTWTSSLIVGHGHGNDNSDGVMGIAPNATIVSVGTDVGEADGDIAEAIKWLADKKVDIISVSMNSESDYDAVDYATGKDIPVVASAGNRSPDPFVGTGLNTFMSWPAYAPGAIPVSGTRADEKFWEGSVDLTGAAQQPKLGISAPSDDIMGAKKGGSAAAHDGTSASAPIVAGTLALIKSAYPDLTYEQWIDRLLDTTDDKGPKGYDDKFGSGIVNPYRALTEETTFNTHDGKAQVSSPDDRLPLEAQGKSPKENSKSGENRYPKMPWMLVAFGVVTVILIAGATVALMATAAKRRKDSQRT